MLFYLPNLQIRMNLPKQHERGARRAKRVIYKTQVHVLVSCQLAQSISKYNEFLIVFFRPGLLRWR
jgi:hypothetical protein